MKTNFKHIICLVMVIATLLTVVPFGITAASEPVVSVDNYTVTVTNADEIKDMRYAPGKYTTASEIKAAEGNVAISSAIVSANTADGVFTYSMPYSGYYSLWIRMKDGTNYIKELDVTRFTPYVSSYGVKITVHNLYDVKDFYIAKGEYNSYREIKDHGYIVSVSGAKVGTKHDYTYTVYEPGVHTVLVRHNDGTQDLFHHELTVDEPVFTENGLQVIISNLPDVKVIRTAYGSYTTVKEMKATDTIRNFSAKTAIKGRDPYTIQYREDGEVTIVVEYNNGYQRFFHYCVDHREPEVAQDEDTVTFGSLTGLQVIRYAPGVYNNSTDIKNAAGSQYVRPEAAVDGVITVKLAAGTYTFCVQYNDESFNYYVITVDCSEHAWGEWAVTTEPTYKTEGEETRECTVCGETDTRAVPMLVCSHTWGEWVVTTEPTYKTEGEETRVCSVCGETETQSVPVLVCSHTWGDWTVVTAATEEAEGLEERSCGICGAKEERAIPKLEPVVVPTATRIHVSCAFSDNMILQRDEKLSVWGTADANSGDVVVNFGGKSASAKVDMYGNWKATFKDTFSYTTEGQPLEVCGADGNVLFSNVLIGDVYYAVGQSNIFYSLGELMLDLKLKGLSNTLDVDFDDRRDIRFYRVSNTDYINMTGVFAQGTSTLYTDVYNGGHWMVPTEIAQQILTYANFTPTSQTFDRTAISTKCFSALGYLFAYNMSKRSDVPVGVIEIDASGHPLITFAPNELADKWGHDVLDATGRYYYSLSNVAVNTTMRTRYAYNQQIHPLSGFSCAGIIWYQGESDMYNIKETFGREYNNNFPVQFTELMTYFRNTFGNDDFPVYLIEYPTCNNNADVVSMDFGGVRAELGTIPQMLENSYIVSSSDMWNDPTWWNNVHPYIKHYQATRLADIVAAQKHGIGDLNDVHGPVLDNVTYTDLSKAELTFNYVGDGLTTVDGTGYVKGIEVQIEYNGQLIWLPHEGEVIVDKNKILIDTGEFVLYGVRYNRQLTAKYPETLTLCNSHGMPAIAFVDYRMP